jgi:recombination protein RecA
VEKSGSWFSYKGERIGQGRENARQFLKLHPQVLARLDTELRTLLKVSAGAETAAMEPPAAVKAVQEVLVNA